jgi:hypothetical protein
MQSDERDFVVHIAQDSRENGIEFNDNDSQPLKVEFRGDCW